MWRIAVASVALPVACLALRDVTGPTRPLAFGPDGTFQISILDDLHYGEAASSYGPIQDALTTKTIANLLADEPQTDFVVINGDLISRDNIFFDNTTHYIDQLVQPILDRNLTWATLHGNHDPGYNRSVEAMLAREQRWPNSRTRSMVPDPQRVGVTNYYLPIYPVDCPTGCGCAPALPRFYCGSSIHEVALSTRSSGLTGRGSRAPIGLMPMLLTGSSPRTNASSRNSTRPSRP
ncbi:hypothetical protein VDGD_08121 [Verticillium dahliae]|nr:hypothetical protein VDGD_08121 [Verticillium dahliae]